LVTILSYQVQNQFHGLILVKKKLYGSTCSENRQIISVALHY
jgi:hypothetical protein